jgi:hypothetical protein
MPNGSTNRVLGLDRYCASRPDVRGNTGGRARDAVYEYLEAVFAIVNTTKCGEGQPDFGSMHLNSRIFRLTTVRIYLLSSFAARAPIVPIVRRSASGGMSPIARCRGGGDVYEGSRMGQRVR